MNKIKIFSDSSCDLSPDLLTQYGIDIIPLYVIFGEKAYIDGVDITTSEIYEKVKETNTLPKTSAITQLDFEEIFKKWYDEGYDIIYTGISGKMSRTFESATLAQRAIDPERKRVFVVDSMNLSTGIGLLLLKASVDRANGMDAKTIAERMEYNAKHAKVQFAIEQMDYLHKGGRCSSTAKIFGTLLKIKPIIFVRDGAMTVGMKPLGKMKVALDKMLKMLEEDKNKGNVDPEFIFVTDAIAVESSGYLFPKVKELFPNTKVMHTTAGGVVSSHCGPGTIGILYICKDEVHLN